MKFYVNHNLDQLSGDIVIDSNDEVDPVDSLPNNALTKVFNVSNCQNYSEH